MDKFKVNIDDTLLLVIDVQERLAPAMAPERFGRMLDNLERLGAAAKVLQLPTVLTEQYPKGLGPTVSSVRTAFEAVPALSKTSFSAMGDPEIAKAVQFAGKSTVLVAGMETHVCVWQTVRDLLPTHRVHLVVEGAIGEGDAFVDGLKNSAVWAQEDFQMSVHNLSGTAAIIGATRLRNTLTQLETKLRAQSTVDLNMWSSALRVLWAETRTGLVAYADALNNGKNV